MSVYDLAAAYGVADRAFIDDLASRAYESWNAGRCPCCNQWMELTTTIAEHVQVCRVCGDQHIGVQCWTADLLASLILHGRGLQSGIRSAERGRRPCEGRS